MTVIWIVPNRAAIVPPCTCKSSLSMGRRIGREVDPDCVVHGEELRQHERETGIHYDKPEGRDIGPLGVAGDPESIAKFVEEFKQANPWWEKNEPDPRILRKRESEIW